MTKPSNGAVAQWLAETFDFKELLKLKQFAMASKDQTKIDIVNGALGRRYAGATGK